MESRWEAAEPRQKFAKRQMQRANQNSKILSEIESWRKSSPAWDAVILACMQTTPEEILITALRLQAQTSPTQNKGGSPPIRIPNLIIDGIATEPGAMVAIQGFQDSLEKNDLLNEFIDTAAVVNFAADPNEPETNKRVFTIRVTFLEMPGDKN
jgi:hypothetical protein